MFRIRVIEYFAKLRSRSLTVIRNGAVRKLGCSFLLHFIATMHPHL